MDAVTLRRKRWLFFVCGLAATFVCVAAIFPLAAATTERIVVNRNTGLAISGFDPVAYFTDGAPKLGHADLELLSAGAVWRFANEGNRAAFAADPQVYMPQFGGYDPIAIARGASTAGHPEIWFLSEQKLYLFYSVEARDAFASDPDNAREAAKEAWPSVLQTLSP